MVWYSSIVERGHLLNWFYWLNWFELVFVLDGLVKTTNHLHPAYSAHFREDGLELRLEHSTQIMMKMLMKMTMKMAVMMKKMLLIATSTS